MKFDGLIGFFSKPIKIPFFFSEVVCKAIAIYVSGNNIPLLDFG